MLRGPKQEADKSTIYSKNKNKQLKKEFSGISPNILIGSWGYPFVNVGALSTEDKKEIDNPKKYAQENTDINKIISQRQSLINSKVVLPIKRLTEKFIEQTQEIAKSSKAVDTEVELLKPINSKIEFHQMSMPHGPSAELKKLNITSNATIKKPIERLTSDTDVKATDALIELKKKQIDEYQLTKLLSTASLGQDRKLVPTKWAITAVDNTLGKNIYEEILNYEEIDYKILTKETLGNIFTIIILPGPWSFELFEITLPKTIHNNTDELILSHDYEYPQGRKKYVKETAGAYYASRLAILEYFKKEKRQGQVIIFRTITNRYTAPLGVWVVREGVRNTIQTEKNKKIKIDQPNSRRELIIELKKILSQQGINNSETIINESQILQERQLGIKKWNGFN